MPREKTRLLFRSKNCPDDNIFLADNLNIQFFFLVLEANKRNGTSIE